MGRIKIKTETKWITNKEDWKQCFSEEWNKMGQEATEKLMLFMSRRLQVAIASQENSIKGSEFSLLL